MNHSQPQGQPCQSGEDQYPGHVMHGFSKQYYVNRTVMAPRALTEVQNVYITYQAMHQDRGPVWFQHGDNYYQEFGNCF